MEIREEKAAIIGIFIKDFDAVPKVNGILHDYAEDIIGRIGIPCRDRDLHVISIILSTTPDRISALSGKLGRIEGITAKAMQAMNIQIMRVCVPLHIKYFMPLQTFLITFFGIFSNQMVLSVK